MWEIYEKLRLQKGVSTYQVCKDTGITSGTITNWKMGRYKPKADKLKLLADYFGVTLEYLMGVQGVQKNGQEEVYYLNQETALKAQRAYEKYGILFDAAEGCKPEDIQMAVDLLNRLKETNIDG